MLSKITLYLARNSEFPSGSTSHGYEIIAPLDQTGHINLDSWQHEQEHCRVRRFWCGEDDRLGRLLHRTDGAAGATWLFDYDSTRTDDDEVGYKLDSHAFIPGNHVSIRDHTGVHTFWIAAVDKWPIEPMRSGKSKRSRGKNALSRDPNR